MSYRPPTVKLPMPHEKIDGQPVTFRPVRDGIDSDVSGILQVIEDADGLTSMLRTSLVRIHRGLGFIGSISLRSI